MWLTKIALNNVNNRKVGEQFFLLLHNILIPPLKCTKHINKSTTTLNKFRKFASSIILFNKMRLKYSSKHIIIFIAITYVTINIHMVTFSSINYIIKCCFTHKICNANFSYVFQQIESKITLIIFDSYGKYESKCCVV